MNEGAWGWRLKKGASRFGGKMGLQEKKKRREMGVDVEDRLEE